MSNEVDFAKHIKGRVAVFIDAANVLYSQKSLGWRINFKLLAKYLKENLDPVFIGYYYGIDDDNEGQKRFLDIMLDHGYTLRTKPVKFIKLSSGDIIRKGNLDIELAIDLVLKKDEFDTCLLFSGDSDFEGVLNLLKQGGKKIIVLSTKRHVSIELIRVADKYMDLRKLKDKIGKKIPPIRKNARG